MIILSFLSAKIFSAISNIGVKLDSKNIPERTKLFSMTFLTASLKPFFIFCSKIFNSSF
jgi:hypothetical protein